MANTDKYFVIAIGGTGMRCLESFTHLCAMGLFDSMEINILTLDTDQTNGNKERAENLVKQYNRIKTTPNKPGGLPNNDTFFSAKLNLYRFWTDYNSAARTNFKNISQIHVDEDGDNQLLADLFLDENVQQFNLAHGYRAQTHLGSYLMYHAIIEAARSLKEGKELKSEEQEFGAFFDKIFKAESDAKVFVFGSIFGGTGASSIPVIPKALNDAIKIRGGDKMSLSKDAKFGSTLLTEYFSFKKPDATQLSSKDDSVIADSSYFTLNSQAALQFYQGDPTVQRTYKRMYHIGWPIEAQDFSKDKGEKRTITGGGNQKNPCHVTELLCACAAYDFFVNNSGDQNTKAEYLYKSARLNGTSAEFDYNDFIGNDANGKHFGNKFGAFVSFMHLALSTNHGAKGDNGVQGFLNLLEQQNVHHYSSLETKYSEELTDYLRKFGYHFEGQNFVDGWLYQIKNSVGGKFIFDDVTFTRDPKELDKFDPGKIWTEKDYHWDKPMIGNRYQTFVKTLVDRDTEPKESQKCSETKEKFLAHVYNAIKKAQKFNA